MPGRNSVTPDRDRAKELLAELWDIVLNDQTIVAPLEIAALVNSNQVAVRFSLPTQLLGKLTDNDLDALSLQKGKEADSTRWDPRGFASKVIVPWNRNNQNVLGASADPYVSNPLRRPRPDVGLENVDDPDEWRRLTVVLARVQDASSAELTRSVLLQVLAAIRDRLRDFTFEYVLPPRVSLKQATGLVQRFLAVQSGGDRGLAVAAAFFKTVGERSHLYAHVRRGVINAADAATGSAGDLECVDEAGKLIFAVEVKERRLRITDVADGVRKARHFSVQELLFCTEGVQDADKEEVDLALANAWASGTNVYHLTINGLIANVLPLIGETGIRQFITNIGAQLDAFNTQPKHRKAWRSLLDAL